MRFKTLIGGVSAALALLTALPAASAGAAAPCGADVEVPLRTFNVVAKWTKKKYHVGDTAKLKVLVTRTSKYDPVTDEGIEYPGGPPISEPAADVIVGASVFVGHVFLAGGAVTGQDGTAVVPIKIEKYAKPGKATSSIYANKILIRDFPSSACRVNIREYGYPDVFPTFKVVP